MREEQVGYRIICGTDEIELSTRVSNAITEPLQAGDLSQSDVKMKCILHGGPFFVKGVFCQAVKIVKTYPE